MRMGVEVFLDFIIIVDFAFGSILVLIPEQFRAYVGKVDL